MPLTRSKLSSNPQETLVSPLKSNPFSRSSKIQRSPPKVVDKTNNNQVLNLPSTQIADEAIKLNTPNTSIREFFTDSLQNTFALDTIDRSIDKNLESFANSTQNTRQIQEHNLQEFNNQSPTLPTRNEMAERSLKLPLKDVAALVPEFDGKNIAVAEYIDKLKQAQKIIDDTDEANLTKILLIKLRGEAYKALYNSTAANIEDLISAIKKLYPIGTNYYELYGKLEEILQNENESVINYTNRIRDLVIRIKEIKKSDNNITAQQLRDFENQLDNDAARYFKDGLKFEIRANLGDYVTLQDNSLAAINIENKQNRQRAQKSSLGEISQINNAYSSFTPTRRTVMCQICHDRNHEALFCRAAACVYCKNSDHFSNDCTVVKNKIQLICRYCSKIGHSISSCKLNLTPGNHCQYCQEMGHEVSQCPFIREYEVCWKCMKSGHNPNTCQFINKPELCENCNKTGHTIQNCPDIICQKCNKRGHATKFCKVDTFDSCYFCEEHGHNTSDYEQMKILVSDFKQKQQTKCQLCDNFGHTGKECPRFMNQRTYTNRMNQKDNYKTSEISCEYCKIRGHTVNQCMKLKKLQDKATNKISPQCLFCKKTGHTIDKCYVLKNLEEHTDNFCKYCKSLGHTEQTCRRNSGNEATLSQTSA